MATTAEALRPVSEGVGAVPPPVKPARKTRAATHRIQDEPTFVLHAWPWRETSLIVDAFTRHHGRVALVAKGAKRPTSKLRPVLLSFQAFTASWSGRAEMKTLTGAEWVGGHAALQGGALLGSFYLNELLLKLLHREDPHPQLFDDYAQALMRLRYREEGPDQTTDHPTHDAALRWFELRLLRELGHLPRLDQVSHSGEPVEPGRLYEVDLSHGVYTDANRDSLAESLGGHAGFAAQGDPRFRGELLLAVESGAWENWTTAEQNSPRTNQANELRRLLGKLLGELTNMARLKSAHIMQMCGEEVSSV